MKEWVLAVSMDNKVEQKLPTDERGVFEVGGRNSLFCKSWNGSVTVEKRATIYVTSQSGEIKKAKT